MKIARYAVLAVLLLAFAGRIPAQTVLLQEDFSSGTLPAGWTNDSAGATATFAWTFDNPGGRTVLGTGFDTSFVILDSDHYGFGNTQEASLTTAPFSAAGMTSVVLTVDEQFFSSQAVRSISVSADSGLTWIPVLSDSATTGYPVALRNTFILDTLAGATAAMIRFTYSGTWDYWWAIDNVTVTGEQPCSAPPSAGNAVSSHAAVCAHSGFLLSLSGNTGGTGLTVQWLASPDALTWTPLAGATAPEWTAFQDSATWYRCLVTCSGMTDSSAAVAVAMNDPSRCYCIPQTPSCSNINTIARVALEGTTLDNISSCDENDLGYAYGAFPPSGQATAVLHQGSTYTLRVTATGTNVISAWIDYDGNGTFDSGEWLQVSTASSQLTPATVSFTVPDSAVIGTTGLRIRTRATGLANGPTDACTAFQSGETEDYLVTIDSLLSGIRETAFDYLAVYPNPATGRIRVDIGLPAGKHLTLSLHDLSGAALRTMEAVSGRPVTVDCGDLAGGVYLLRVCGDAGCVTRRVVVLHP
jgi:hypothetical protein